MRNTLFPVGRLAQEIHCSPWGGSRKKYTVPRGEARARNTLFPVGRYARDTLFHVGRYARDALFPVGRHT